MANVRVVLLAHPEELGLCDVGVLASHGRQRHDSDHVVQMLTAKQHSRVLCTLLKPFSRVSWHARTYGLPYLPSKVPLLHQVSSARCPGSCMRRDAVSIHAGQLSADRTWLDPKTLCTTPSLTSSTDSSSNSSHLSPFLTSAT